LTGHRARGCRPHSSAAPCAPLPSGGVRTATVIAATVVRAAPTGFGPDGVIALVEVDGVRELHRLPPAPMGAAPAPAPGDVIRVGRADPRFSSPAAVAAAPATD
jgi:hypothetical protein